MPRLELVLSLFIKTLIDMMTLFLIKIVFELAQIYVILFLVIFLDYSSIDLGDRGIKYLVLQTMIQAKFFFLE